MTLLSYARFAKDLGISYSDVIAAIHDEETDFEVDNYRFIADSEIDEVMESELEGDEYILGCFNAWFLADVLGVDTDVIEAMQKAEAYEAIGKLVISMGKTSELQQAYASADGYGHHFNSWDGSDDEIGSYHVFRTN